MLAQKDESIHVLYVRKPRQNLVCLAVLRQLICFIPIWSHGNKVLWQCHCIYFLDAFSFVQELSSGYWIVFEELWGSWTCKTGWKLTLGWVFMLKFNTRNSFKALQMREWHSTFLPCEVEWEASMCFSLLVKTPSPSVKWLYTYLRSGVCVAHQKIPTIWLPTGVAYGLYGKRL